MPTRAADPAEHEAPTVRKRPRDRKARIVAAAARLFWERGFHQVGMADIAAEVGIGASALYRHFRGKGDLLAAVLAESLDGLERAVEAGGALDDQLRAIAAAALEHRDFAALWERAVGQLAADRFDRLRARRLAVLDRLTSAIGARLGEDGTEGRAEDGVEGRNEDGTEAELRLRVRAVVAVLESPSHHRTELDPERFVALLHRAASAVLAAPLPGPGGGLARAAPGRPQLPVSRREALLAAAGGLFAERGYSAVSLDDIGAAIGIAGPSVYNHFPSKADVLLSTLRRGNEALWFALHQALAGAEGPADALGRLLDSYVAAMASNPEIVTVLINEVGSLPVELSSDLHRTQRDYVAEWVALLRRSREELAEPEARLLVHATLGLANSLLRRRPSPERPTFEADLGTLGRAVLQA